MSEIKHHTIRANDIRQHYIEAGDGAPVVCSMAFPRLGACLRNSQLTEDEKEA